MRRKRVGAVYRVQIFDMNQRLVKRYTEGQSGTGALREMSVSNLENGVYILIVRLVDGQRHYRQLIIRK
jgi:hypothetical protein